MVIFSLYLKSEVPFKNVYLHGMVNDAKGQKMSKSKGNIVSPIDLIDEFGADALRIGMVVGNTPGSDMALSKDKIKGYKHFANKLWNLSRFILSNTVQTEVGKPNLTESEHNILLEFEAMLIDITQDIESYRLYLASEKLYHYIWHTFADKIIEESKEILKTGSDEQKYNRSWILMYLLKNSIVALHPFMPFITEELWSFLPETPNLLLIEKWPTTGKQ
jgi:valyl-tRNA synthetase